MISLISGSHMEMVGVGKLHLRSDAPKIIGGDGALDGRRRAHIHETPASQSPRGRCCISGPLCAAVLRQNLISAMRLLLFFLISQLPDRFSAFSSFAFSAWRAAWRLHHVHRTWRLSGIRRSNVPQMMPAMSGSENSRMEETPITNSTKTMIKVGKGRIDTSRKRLCDTFVDHSAARSALCPAVFRCSRITVENHDRRVDGISHDGEQAGDSRWSPPTIRHTA